MSRLLAHAGFCRISTTEQGEGVVGEDDFSPFGILLIFDRNQHEPINATQILIEQDIRFRTTYNTSKKVKPQSRSFGKNSDGKVGRPNLMI